MLYNLKKNCMSYKKKFMSFSIFLINYMSYKKHIYVVIKRHIDTRVLGNFQMLFFFLSFVSLFSRVLSFACVRTFQGHASSRRFTYKFMDE